MSLGGPIFFINVAFEYLIRCLSFLLKIDFYSYIVSIRDFFPINLQLIRFRPTVIFNLLKQYEECLRI